MKRNAFGDIVNMLRNSKCFHPFLGASTSSMLSMLTPAQRAAGAKRGVDLGSIQIIAAPTTTTSGRGPAVIGVVPATRFAARRDLIVPLVEIAGRELTLLVHELGDDNPPM